MMMGNCDDLPSQISGRVLFLATIICEKEGKFCEICQSFTSLSSQMMVDRTRAVTLI